MPSQTAALLASIRTPRSQVETRQPWTVSFTEAAKHDTVKEVVMDRNGYHCGNNDSTSFMKKMATSFAECSRLRQQCRQIACAAPSRAPAKEDTVSLSHCRKSIEEAKAISAFSLQAVSDMPTAKKGSGAPEFVGHLGLPGPTPEQTGDLGSVSNVELPGAIQNLEDKAEKDAFPSRGNSVTPSTEAGQSWVSRIASTTPSAEVWGRDSVTPERLEPPQEEPEEQAFVPRFNHNLALVREGEASTSHTVVQPPRRLSDEDNEELDSDSDEDDETEDSEERWPPVAPIMRFKMISQFQGRFRPASEGNLLAELAKTSSDKMIEKVSVPIEDAVVTVWLNRTFKMSVETVFQFETGFPLIVLSVLDAIYPRRVPWRQVNWRLQYQKALVRNYEVLARIWDEVNMDHAREFRVEHASMVPEHMMDAPLEKKLSFLKIIRRWFDSRIHASGPYDPQAKRLEIVQSCKAWGHTVDWPPWILYDESQEAKYKPKVESDWDKMPEYKRLINFLGSNAHQSM